MELIYLLIAAVFSGCVYAATIMYALYNIPKLIDNGDNMMHDNDPGYETTERILPSTLAKRKYPEVDGIYAVKCKDDIIGLIHYHNKEWFSYPTKFSLNTNTINETIEYCIGPI